MNIDMKILLESSLYFLALINPASKIFLLSSIQPPLSGKKLISLSLQSTVVAFIILLLVTVLGNLVLRSVFHVEIYSLKVAGGIILFIIGLQAVRNGRFYESSLHGSLSDLSVVPLGAPLIAGPGTITAAISYRVLSGIEHTMIAITIALAVNFVLMVSSIWIAKILDRFNVIGPLIRITGLIVAAVSVQMILGGLGEWYAVIK
ncbi:MAG TPA: MarC family protein [Lentisphaeria bacterium]|nr:MarC family protein [Lentisphaeria bacterium]